MPAGAISPTPKAIWEQIKIASIAGVLDEKLAEKYGVSREAIRARRSREKWVTKRRVGIERRAAREALQNGEQIIIPPSTGQTNVTDSVTSPPSANEVVAESLDEMADELARAVAPVLLKQTKDAVTHSPLDFKPQNLKELGQVISSMWKLTGKDRPQTAVQVNLGFTPKSGSQHWLDSAQVVEAEGDERE